MTTAQDLTPTRWPLWPTLLAVAALASLSHRWQGAPTLLWGEAPAASVSRASVAEDAAAGPAASASAVNANEASNAAAVTPAAIEAMVQRLADRLQQSPADVDGWRRLARAYQQLERLPQAITAYRGLLQQQPDDADALCELAVLLAIEQGQAQLPADSIALVQRALRADPKHLQALALAGGIALDAGRPQEAQRLWRQVLDQVPPGTELARNIEASIARAARR